MTKHTPGPWVDQCGHIHGAGNVAVATIDDNMSDERVREGSTLYPGQPEGQANAHLIAAAPDLLAACENLENDDGSIPEHAWRLVQDAIDKARGGG
jgi:hypothetical protein